MNKIGLLTCFLMVAGLSVLAQKLSGDITPLKGQKEVNVVLVFSGTLVNGETEDKYIAKETKDKTEKEKEKWLSEWNERLRSDAYSMLIRDLNKIVGAKLFLTGDYPQAEYTINIKIKDITTGYFKGPFTQPSELKADVGFVKKSETTPFATAIFKNSCSFYSSVVPYFVARIAMSFGTLGGDIGKIIYKTIGVEVFEMDVFEMDFYNE